MPTLLTRHETDRSAPPTGRGPDQGVIEEAKHRQRSRRARTSAAMLAALVGVGVLAWVLSREQSPNHPRGAQHAGIGAAASRRAGASASFGIRLSPALDGGQYGWCVAVQEPGFSGIAGGGCATTPTESTPLSMVLSGGSASTRKESIVVLTTPQVAAILVGGRRRVAAVELPGLPYGLRAARIVIPFLAKKSATGRTTFQMPPEPSLAALDSSGQLIASPATQPQQQEPPLSARGPCTLAASGIPGISAQWSHVASAITPYPGRIVGRAFFSCIDTEYYLHKWPLDAAILLDAAHPGSPPAAIPDLSAVTGEAGFLNGPGDFKGQITATRLEDAWLVVAGGSGLSQRIDLLRHLRATVRLSYRGVPAQDTQPQDAPPTRRPGTSTSPTDL